jgi:hypothetical protein
MYPPGVFARIAPAPSQGQQFLSAASARMTLGDVGSASFSRELQIAVG